MIHGKLITIEGIEGAGKTTALQFIQTYLSASHKEILLTREPGGTEIAEEIRQLLLHPKIPETIETIQPMTELLLLFAGRCQHIQQLILPALQKGQWVISDRFIDASYAYQGGGRGIPMDHILALDQLVVGNLSPDLTLLLDVSVELGCARAEKRQTKKDRIEQEHLDFFRRVREVYLARAKQYPKRIRVIDANLELSAVQTQIRGALDEFILNNRDL